LGEHSRADECRYTGSHTQRVNLDSMARDTQHAMGQIGDSQGKERSTDKGSTAEGEIFHQLDMPLWNVKTTQLREKENRRGEPAYSTGYLTGKNFPFSGKNFPFSKRLVNAGPTPGAARLTINGRQ
jgi:hypothetical protein